MAIVTLGVKVVPLEESEWKTIFVLSGEYMGARFEKKMEGGGLGDWGTLG